jgi:hypothetical protein
MTSAIIIELVLKVALVVGSIFGTYRLLHDIVLSRKPVLRDEYQFVKTFIADVVSVQGPHPYMVEKGFAAISGKHNLTSAEILYLLDQPKPSLSIKRYSAARMRFVEFSDQEQRIVFIKSYLNKNKRKWFKAFNFTGYILFAILALCPLFFTSDLFGENWKKEFSMLLMFFIIFAPQCYFCIIRFFRINMGELLIAGQSN